MKCLVFKGFRVILLVFAILLLPIPIAPNTVCQAAPSIVGVEWNQGTDTWIWIDVDGNGIGEPNFNAVSPWQDIVRCTLAADGTENEVSVNGKGDDISLDGSTGRVMVRIPKFWVKSDSPGANRYRWWISSASYAGFEVHPAFNQRAVDKPAPYIYVGAYEAGYDGVSKLRSQTGDTVLVSQTIGTFRTRAENIGSGWGITNIWALSAIKMLYYVEYADADSQTAIGKGIVDDAAKSATGADGIDANLATSGTGSGTSTDGSTPIAYRGVENLWGNVYQFIDGYEAVDAEYRIIKPDGSGTFRNPLQAGDYEASTAAPITTDGYIKDIEYETLLAYLFIPSDTAGSSGTYLYDQFYAHDTGEVNILLAGGSWTTGALAGVACLLSIYDAAYSTTYVGGRLEFIAFEISAPTVTTQAATSVEDTTATLNGTVTDDGGAIIDYYGFVWDDDSDEGDPGDVDPSTPAGDWENGWKSGEGDYGENPFDHAVSALPAGTTIYFRAAAHNSEGWSYSAAQSFLTKPAAPTNVAATDGAHTDKVVITWTASAGATNYHVWRDAVDLGAAGDVETFDDEGAEPDETVYIYKVVASNATGDSDDSDTDTGWRAGDPTVTTGVASLVEETTATLNGEITDIGGANATARGFEWDTDSGAPYANDWHEDGDFGVDSFTHALDALTKGELYYYRVYAINTYGTGYGSEVTFLTKPDPPNTLVATGNSTQVDLTWVKPASADKTYIRGEDGSYPDDRADGYLVYNDTLELCTDAGLTGGHTYYYKAWSWCTEGGKEQFSDTFGFAFATPGLTVILWYQPVTMVGSTSYDGTADAGSDADTIIDAELTQVDDYWIGALVTITGADAAAPEGETSICTAFAAATDEITVSPAFGAAVEADDTYTVDFGTLLDRAIASGTADSGSDVMLRDAVLIQADDYWIGMMLEIITTTDGLAPQGEIAEVTDFVAADDELQFDALTAVVGAGDTYELRNDGRITWGANLGGISVTIGGMVSTGQPTPGALPADPARDILLETGVTDWYIEPDVTGALLTNPLRPFVTILSDNTTLTEIQAWRLLALAFILLVTVATALAVRSHQGITAIAGGAAILGMVVLTIFPMWALVFAIGMFIGGLVMERSPSL